MTLRNLLCGEKANADQIHPEDASDVFFDGSPANIFDNVKLPAPASATGPYAAPSTLDAEAGSGLVVGGAAGFTSVFSKAANTVVSLMNHTTYFQMKKLAGAVGKVGVALLLDRLAAYPLALCKLLARHAQIPPSKTCMMTFQDAVKDAKILPAPPPFGQQVQHRLPAGHLRVRQVVRSSGLSQAIALCQGGVQGAQDLPVFDSSLIVAALRRRRSVGLTPASRVSTSSAQVAGSGATATNDG